MKVSRLVRQAAPGTNLKAATRGINKALDMIGRTYEIVNNAKDPQLNPVKDQLNNYAMGLTQVLVSLKKFGG